jgi:hypothetical protein
VLDSEAPAPAAKPEAAEPHYPGPRLGPRVTRACSEGKNLRSHAGRAGRKSRASQSRIDKLEIRVARLRLGLISLVRVAVPHPESPPPSGADSAEVLARFSHRPGWRLVRNRGIVVLRHFLPELWYYCASGLNFVQSTVRSSQPCAKNIWPLAAYLV